MAQQAGAAAEGKRYAIGGGGVERVGFGEAGCDGAGGGHQALGHLRGVGNGSAPGLDFAAGGVGGDYLQHVGLCPVGGQVQLERACPPTGHSILTEEQAGILATIGRKKFGMHRSIIIIILLCISRKD